MVFYKINNKKISEIIHDFHSIVLYPPPVKTYWGWFYPWQVWTNNNFEDYCFDFQIRITGMNILKMTDVYTPYIEWVFSIDFETKNFLEKKMQNRSMYHYKYFLYFAYQKYLEGWSFGIVDTYDYQQINSDIKQIMDYKNYDYSVYNGAVQKTF